MPASQPPSTRLRPDAVARAGRLIAAVGGRCSIEAGIDVDGGDAEVERWFLAAALFGTRISVAIAQRTFRVLGAAGLVRIAGARDVSWDNLVVLLDEGGYARYDFRTATRLHALADAVVDRYGGEVAEIGRSYTTYSDPRDALDDLPGWGPVTVVVSVGAAASTCVISNVPSCASRSRTAATSIVVPAG